jgi:beta-lactamase regulating signal transducer with metallopeptidase domain
METISRSLLTFLLNSVWQIPLVTGVAALSCYVMRKGPASHRHAVWVAALVAGVLLPLASVRSDQHSEPWPVTVSYTPSASVPSEPIPGPARPNPARLPAATRSVPLGQTTALVVVGVYLLFLLFRLGKLAWAWVRTIQIQQSAEARRTPPLLEQVWARSLEAFGVSGVQLLSSPSVSSPLMAGVWCKTIILPDSLFAETSEDVLTTAVGHETAHIARHDFAFNILYELLYVPVSFHPAAWFIRRGIERTREMACDELVTRQLIDPGVYARSLMSIAVGIAGSPRPGYTLGVSSMVTFWRKESGV